jgi:RecB family exonuclease
VLSYRSSDEEGNIALPSPFLSDVAELLVEDWPDRRRRRLLADVVWSPERAPTIRELARARASAEAPPTGEPEPPARSLGATALEHVRHVEILSGGALETYADCPVKWLVERELQPGSLDPELEPMARGSYMHAALEQVLLRLDGPVTNSSLPDARQILQDVLGELPATLAPGRPPSVREAAFRTVEADLNRYLEYEAANGCTWEPRGLELQFGFEAEEGSLRALELGEGAERVRVRGVIDRVDVDPASPRAIVRDYKSGSPRPEQQGARWRTDRRLQVALYMIAVRDLLGLDPIAGLYQPLGGSDLRARGIYLEDAAVGARVVGNDARDADALRAELDDAADRATQLAARLRAGDLTPCPETCSRDGCRYPGICRSQ